MPRFPSVPHPGLTAAVLAGTVWAMYVWEGHAPPAFHSDFDPLHVAARAVLQGQDPYAAVRAAPDLLYPLYYPLTAPVLIAPLGALSARLAVTLFAGFGAALLAYGLAREPWRLWILLSAPVYHAVHVGQWSPWVAAGAWLPWAGLVWAAKPSVGLAYFVAWPSRPAAIGCALLTLLAFLVWPGWVPAWLSTIRGAPYYVAPVFRPLGFLGLLAWLRWRRPEARWLGMLTLIPHTDSVQEMLPLLFVAQTGIELAVLIGLGWVAYLLILFTVPWNNRDVPGMLEAHWPFVFGLLYLPALVLILRRPTAAAPARTEAPR